MREVKHERHFRGMILEHAFCKRLSQSFLRINKQTTSFKYESRVHSCPASHTNA